MSAIQNRIQKNQNRLKAWAKRHNIEAYRLYDRDIPDYPYMVDRYGAYIVVHKRTTEIDLETKKADHFDQLIEALQVIFKIDGSKIHIKDRRREKFKQTTMHKWNPSEAIVVREHEAKFYVDLKHYLDTGLFLDHRPLRQLVTKQSTKKSVLNLFSYTASISISAALAGAKTTSVDLSKTYLQWAQSNFKLNQLDPTQHSFVNEDVRLFLQTAQSKNAKYELIVLDPPTFSNSKKTQQDFEVSKDHAELIDLSMNLLAPQGELYFSTNKRQFRLEANLFNKYLVRDITEASLPQDFRDKKCHKLFLISEII